MTTRYTEDEWRAIINQAEQGLPKSPREYKAPYLGSEDFAKTIDHTILKLDASEEQVDTVCEEARRFHFKVRPLYSFKSSINMSFHVTAWYKTENECSVST